MSNRYSAISTYTLILIMYLVFVGKFAVTKLGLSAPPLINYFLMLSSLLAMIKYIPKYGTFLCKYIAVLIFYLLFKALFYGLDFLSSVVTYSSFLWCFFFCVIIVELTRNNRISVNKLKTHFYIIFLFECVIGIAQYLVPSIYEYFHISTWSWNGTTIEEYVEQNMLVAKAAPIVGTFFQPQTFANLIAIFVMIGCCDLFYFPQQHIKIKLPIIITGFALCFLTGVRAPFLMLVVALSYLIYKVKRSWMIYYVGAIVAITIFFLGFALTDDTGSMARMQLGLEALFSGDIDLLSTQTIFYSFYMVPYFLHDPLFGVSLGEKYVLGYYVMKDFSSTDVLLMYILCEIGIVGLFVFIWPVIKFGKIAKCSSPFNNVKPILLMCFLLSIVDDTFLVFDAKVLYALSMAFFYSVNFTSMNSSKSRI